MRTIRQPAESPVEQPHDGLRALRRERERFVVREAEVARLEARLQRELHAAATPEAHEQLERLIEQLFIVKQDLANFTGQLDSEIAKVAAGEEAYRTTKTTDMKNAFRAYLLTDTYQSLEDSTVALVEYDHIIRSLHTYTKYHTDEDRI